MQSTKGITQLSIQSSVGTWWHVPNPPHPFVSFPQQWKVSAFSPHSNPNLGAICGSSQSYSPHCKQSLNTKPAPPSKHINCYRQFLIWSLHQHSWHLTTYTHSAKREPYKTQFCIILPHPLRLPISLTAKARVKKTAHVSYDPSSHPPATVICHQERMLP